MEIHGHQIAFRWPSNRRLPWPLLSVAAMFVSAYSVFGWMGAVGRISGWTGLPKYEAQIPQLQTQAEVWLGLAIALPFIAALLLGLGAPRSASSADSSMLSYPAESRRWTLPLYVVRLVISVLGTLGFTLCLFLVGLLLHKLGVRAS